MTTARQMFDAACSEALSELRGVPVEKILNRVGIEVILEMRRAMAQQFILLMRDAAEGIDTDRPAMKLRERIARMENMRTITD